MKTVIPRITVCFFRTICDSPTIIRHMKNRPRPSLSRTESISICAITVLRSLCIRFLFSEPRYEIQIYDQKTANADYPAGKTAELDCGNIYTFEVDADMNIIQEWSYGGQAVWDDAHDEAYAMFTRAKDTHKAPAAGNIAFRTDDAMLRDLQARDNIRCEIIPIGVTVQREFDSVKRICGALALICAVFIALNVFVSGFLIRMEYRLRAKEYCIKTVLALICGGMLIADTVTIFAYAIRTERSSIVNRLKGGAL